MTKDERPETTSGREARGLAREAAVFLFFLLLAVVQTWPLVRDLRGAMLQGGDPLVDLWTVHWLASHLLAPGQLFHGNTFHPHAHAVLYSDLSLGTAVLVAPLLPLLGDPVPLYNASVLIALAFGGWAFHVLAREVGADRAGAVMAGVLAAFASHQLYHVYHLNLLTTGWLALFVTGLFRTARRPGIGAAVLTGVSFALTAQSSGYYAVAAALLALLFALLHARELFNRRALAAAGAAALLGAVLTLPYLLAYLDLHEGHRLRRPIGMSEAMDFEPARDLTSHGYLYGRLLGSGGERLFPGLLTLGLCAAALARRARALRLPFVAAAVLLVISLGPSIDAFGARVPMPYLWLVRLPPLDSMRHPYTFAAVATWLLAVAAAAGWSSLALSRRRGAGLLVVAAAVVETLAPGPLVVERPAGLPPAYQLALAQPPGPLLELPLYTDEALLWAARHGRPTLNGQGSAFVPLPTLQLERFLTNHWQNRAPDDLDASKPTPLLIGPFGLRYLIVPSGRSHGWGPLVDALERSRSFRRVGRAADGDVVFEAVPQPMVASEGNSLTK